MSQINSELSISLERAVEENSGMKAVMNEALAQKFNDNVNIEELTELVTLERSTYAPRTSELRQELAQMQANCESVAQQRLATLAHADELRTALEMTWNAEAKAALDAVLDTTPVPPGPVYGVERVVDGPHGAIMRYNLNRE